jgi:hypothetical protein
MRSPTPFKERKFLTQQVSKDKLIDFAKTYAQNSIEGGIALKQSPNISRDELMKVMRIYCKYNSMRLVETATEGKRIAIIVHEAGLNESLFVANYYKALFWCNRCKSRVHG